ncbi:MAG: tagatose 1,6-diphosphate aldolase [Proteobacteria bacterium]|nr:tagatose 1,6-diphosphate aldolase [Pseudomonadota bacterium]
MELSAGKLWCFRRLADKNGLFKMTAVDQRPPIMNLVKEKKGVAEASYQDVSDVKALLTKTLAPSSTAMLLDPIWAYPNAIQHVDPAQGLLITLEEHDFLDTEKGRISTEIVDWSVEKIKRIGADGVKFLAWYRPDADPALCDYQHKLVEKIGNACKKHDICFLLEMLVYPLPGDSDQTKEYVEHASKHPQNVVDSLKAFADPAFGVDIFKLESPVPGSTVPEPGSPGAAECQEWFNQLDQISQVPWVMLSAGADMKTFKNILTYAYNAGASGYLAGRAIWWQAAQSFPDLATMEKELMENAVPYAGTIGSLTDQQAKPWHQHRAFEAGITPPGFGPNFPKEYSA